MKRLRYFACILALVFMIATTPVMGASAQSTAFTYQGQLDASGALANGNYTFVFKLFDDSLTGTQIGTIQQPIQIVNGLFTADLDYGPVFNGTQLWLEITINGQTLVPRQPINIAPVAQYALNAPNGVFTYVASPTNAQWIWSSAYSFDTAYNSWGEYFTRYVDIAAPELTQDVLDHGTVQVFFTPHRNSPNLWTPLPFSFLDVQAQDFFWRVAFETNPGSVRLHFFLENIKNSSTTAPELSSFTIPTYKFKVVVTKGTAG